MTKKTARAAIEALRTYNNVLGTPADGGGEELATQASDMITDLLLTFSMDDASDILYRVQRDNIADRAN